MTRYARCPRCGTLCRDRKTEPLFFCYDCRNYFTPTIEDERKEFADMHEGDKQFMDRAIGRRGLPKPLK